MKKFKPGQLVIIRDNYEVALRNKWDFGARMRFDSCKMNEITNLFEGEVCIVFEDGFVSLCYVGTKLLTSSGMIGYIHKTALRSL